MFWALFSDEIVEHIQENVDGVAKAKQGLRGPRVGFNKRSIRAFVRVVVHIIAHGLQTSRTLTEYLSTGIELRQGRFLRDDGKQKFINLRWWRSFNKHLATLNKEHLAEYITASSIRFWGLSSMMYLTLDESVIGFLGNIPFRQTIPRKPVPTGALVFVVATKAPLTGRPIPLIFIPSFKIRDARVTPLSALSLTCHSIRQQQDLGTFGKELCLTVDAAFCSLGTMLEFFPDIRFVMSLREDAMKALLASGLGQNEARIVHKGNILITAFVDNAILYNATTLFTSTSTPPSQPPPVPRFSPEGIQALSQLPLPDLQQLCRLSHVTSSGTANEMFFSLTNSHRPTNTSTKRANPSTTRKSPQAKRQRRPTPTPNPEPDIQTEPTTTAFNSTPLPTNNPTCDVPTETEEELQKMPVERLKTILMQKGGKSSNKNKRELIEEILWLKGPSAEAARARMAAFLQLKARGRPPTIKTYNLLSTLLTDSTFSFHTFHFLGTLTPLTQSSLSG